MDILHKLLGEREVKQKKKDFSLCCDRLEKGSQLFSTTCEHEMIGVCELIAV